MDKIMSLVGGDKIKILGGFNSDLINKEATVTGMVGDMIEVMVAGRESMRYTMPASVCIKLDSLKVTNPEELKAPVNVDAEPVKVFPDTSLNDEDMSFLKNTIDSLEKTLKGLKERYEHYKKR